MTHGHGFWFYLTWGCVVWYAITTIYVAIRGSIDIKAMLRRLKERDSDDSGPGSASA